MKHKLVITYFILAILASFLISAPTIAATYYVDATNGNDSNPGTSNSTPWKSIARVNNNSFLPGDFILFKRGEIWREQLIVPSSGSNINPITFGAFGIGNDPIISGADILSGWTADTVPSISNVYYHFCLVKPQQVFASGIKLTEKSSKAILTSGSWWFDSTNSKLYICMSGGDHPSGYTVEASQRDKCIAIWQKSYITLENVRLTMGQRSGIFWTGGPASDLIIESVESSYNYHTGIQIGSGAESNNLENATIRNCKIHHNGGNGIWMSDYSVSITIQNNTIHDNCAEDDDANWQNYTAGIRVIGIHSRDIVIEENEIYNEGTGMPNYRGWGIHVDTTGPECIVRYNHIYNCNLEGIYIEDVNSGADVYFNIAKDNRGAGIGIYRSENCKVYNNTAYANTYGIQVSGYSATDQAKDNIINNNICDSNTKELRAFNGGDNDGINGSGNIYLYNCFGVEKTNFIEWGGGYFYSTYEHWETVYGSSTKSVEADPKMKDPNNDDFTLQRSSPCISAGTNVGLLRDFAGSPIVTQGLWVDIGALKYLKVNSPVGFRFEKY